jgi:methyltransferase (TIGR00027 family)
VQKEKASGTALVISSGLVLLHRDPKYSYLVSKTSADVSNQVLATYTGRTRWFLPLIRQPWFPPIARCIERVTIPGILLHYALRKRCIATLARSALVNGATQLVVIGAGFDPLSFELQREYPSTNFWEVDYPPTQRHKINALSKLGSNRLHFVSADLNASGLDKEALISGGFDPCQRTFWIAEGLLMYLREETVASLMNAVSGLSAPGSQFAFTFMEKLSNGRIGFQWQRKRVNRWLRRRGEPFLWASTRSALVDVIRPWRVIRFFGDLREMESQLADEPVAKGEVICLAEI